MDDKYGCRQPVCGMVQSINNWDKLWSDESRYNPIDFWGMNADGMTIQKHKNLLR
jgi:hypothetical protein